MNTAQLLLGSLVLAGTSCLAANRGITPVATSSPLQALIAEEWAARMRDDPLLATQSDVHDYDHLLPSVAPGVYERQLQRDRDFQERLARLLNRPPSTKTFLVVEIFNYLHLYLAGSSESVLSRCWKLLVCESALTIRLKCIRTG